MNLIIFSVDQGIHQKRTENCINAPTQALFQGEIIMK